MARHRLDRAMGLLALVGVTVSAQPTTPPTAAARHAVSAWQVVAPDAPLAWFDLLAALSLDGPGAFAFTAAPSAPAVPLPLVTAVRAEPSAELLHFLPLYYPSADRAALAAALRVAAADSTPAMPRATLLVSALRQSMPPAVRRALLPPLAAALEQRSPTAPPALRLADWQARLHTEFLPALRPWLAHVRLDAGRLLVMPALGAEGRLFAATASRGDNLIAVGEFATDPDPDAPLYAFVRESCTATVSTIGDHAKGSGGRAERATRDGVAAVRCGALLLDRVLPARASAYRAFWVRQARQPALAFDRVFPAVDAYERPLLVRLARLARRTP